MLYELTTGARCFQGASDFDRMLAVVRGDYVAPSVLVADYPPELEQVVRTALATDPHHRFASCAAMIDALERVLLGRGWAGGAGAIQRLMVALFGVVVEPWLAGEDAAAAPRTLDDVAPFLAVAPTPAMAPTARITRPTRLARGTLSDMFDPQRWAADEDEARTRGRHVRSPRQAALT